MNESEALTKMVAPGQRRPGVWKGGVLQILVTSRCDFACMNCTQASNLSAKRPDMTVEQFEQACISLKGYFGVVGVFGGNPAVRKDFGELCRIMRKHIPRERCGLWCNNLFGHGSAARQTFNPSVSNLNVHLSQKAYDEFKRDWPQSMPFGLHEDSRHSPPYVAMQDLPELSESDRWELISGCDVNQKWSAILVNFRGELRGFFCEVAGAQALLHQHEPDYPDLGVPVVRGEPAIDGEWIDCDWWKRPMQDEKFAAQARFNCHACGIPLRGHGALAQGPNGQVGDGSGQVEQVSKTHAGVYQPKPKGREVEIVELQSQLGSPLARSTDYVQNARGD